MIIEINAINDSAPDVENLMRAKSYIEKVYDLIAQMKEMITKAENAAPESVLAPSATFYKMMVDVENEIDSARLKAYHLKNKYQMRILPDLFIQSSTSKTSTLNGYTVSMSQDFSISIPKDCKHAAYEWLKDNGLGDIITTTVNSSTLKATLKEWDNQNKPMPPDDLIKVSQIPKYSVVKSSRKIPTA